MKVPGQKVAIMTVTSTLVVLLAAGLAPTTTHAATFEVSGWLPYWAAASSSADVLPHLSQLTEINPFGFSVKDDGTLADTAGLLAYAPVPYPAAVVPQDMGLSTTSPYYPLILQARAQGVRVIPTVMWSDTDAINTVLSSTTLREGNVQAIVAMVKQGGFDGVDIDYEGKEAADINYFSDFLQELYAAMGNKWVDCSIEARTPPADLNTNVSLSQIQYANDFTAINKYCDRVKLMTYDQESIDKTLNNAAGDSIYTPVADPKWDTAVVELAEKSISPSKIELGIPTYGYEYDVTPYANGTGWIYNLLWAFDPGYATQLENLFHVTPLRDSAGELAFTYTPTSTPETLPSGTSSASPTNANQTASVGTAVVQAAYTPLTGTERYVTWDDSVAIAQKIALAKQLGIRGVAIFKLDGGEDPNIWNVLP